MRLVPLGTALRIIDNQGGRHMTTAERLELVRQLAASLEDHERNAGIVRLALRSAMMDARETGATLADIAQAANISTARAGQITGTRRTTTKEDQ